MKMITSEETIYDSTILILHLCILSLQRRIDVYAPQSSEAVKLGVALAAVRSAREQIRDEYIEKQREITT